MPDAAGRSLWLAAAWTGIGAAVIGATLGVLSVAIVWMPASGASGHWTSTVRAGLLTFLAALHGGVTVDGTDTHFLPLGLLVVVGCAAWRAGAVLADTAWSIDETDSVRLLVAGFAQTVAFTLSCLIAVPFAHLGTSSAPVLGVGCAAALLFSLTGGVAFVRWSALGGRLLARLPAMLPRCTRAAAAGLVAYVGFAALLVAGSLVVHHTRVTALSGQVGGGWAGVPILALGVLAAPNAVIAATSYLAGPGFAVGSGTVVGATGTAAHGVLPSFPCSARCRTAVVRRRSSGHCWPPRHSSRGSPSRGSFGARAGSGSGCVMPCCPRRSPAWRWQCWRGRVADRSAAAGWRRSGRRPRGSGWHWASPSRPARLP